MFYFTKIEPSILHYLHGKYITIPQSTNSLSIFSLLELEYHIMVNNQHFTTYVYKEKTYSMLQIGVSKWKN